MVGDAWGQPQRRGHFKVGQVNPLCGSTACGTKVLLRSPRHSVYDHV
jgi:hypothetical protein